MLLFGLCAVILVGKWKHLNWTEYLNIAAGVVFVPSFMDIIQDVAGEIVNILGGDSMDYSE